MAETLVFAVKLPGDLGLFSEDDPLLPFFNTPGNSNNVVPLRIPEEFVEARDGRCFVQGRVRMVPGFGEDVVAEWFPPGEFRF